MIVIDASAVLDILSGTESGLRLEARLKGLKLHAPHLLDLEVASAIRRWEYTAIADRGEGEKLLEAFLDMPIIRYPHTSLLPEIWRLRHNLTPYDAAYLALARVLDAELVTLDGGLRKLAARKR